jgi:UDP-glucose-4-epimerase GalE
VVSRRLREAGHEVVVVDDLSTGHREALDGGPLIEGDFGDAGLVGAALARHRIGAVAHFAASSLVGESMRDPAAYYRNNLVRSLALLDAMRAAGVGRILFSSSAAVYGEPLQSPIPEDHPAWPTNPYGETKLAFERALEWHRAAHGIAWVSLRYFNAAGATADGSLGEDHRPETHLIPIVLRAALDGSTVPVFGTDYDTPDGTAVRDYVHVEDLADAHVRSLDLLERGESAAFNLGNGAGFSVREVIEAAARICGRPIATASAARRPGDPPRLVASSDRARRRLGWEPRLADLGAILETAWRFLRARPGGYAS